MLRSSRQLSFQDLELLSFGSAILGSGGGGDSYYSLLMAEYQFEKYGSPEILSVGDLRKDDLVVPIGIMGAPLVNMERLMSEKKLEVLIQTIEKTLGRKPTVLMAGEIGGSNAFVPLLIAAKLGLPVLDADIIGRAFPELHMNVCYLKGLNLGPSFITDCFGNSVVIETKEAKTLEKLARNVTISMGSSSAIALYIMDGMTAQKSVVSGTLSQAIAIGDTIYQARETHTDPISALVKQRDASIVATGTVINIAQTIDNGFLEGSVTLLTEGRKISVFYQNEYLFASDEKGPIASTPEILMLVEEESGMPITSEKLRYGLQAALLTFPAPAVWKTPEGLALVGPDAFGYGGL